jgi:hypothetical protein
MAEITKPVNGSNKQIVVVLPYESHYTPYCITG